MNEMTFLQIAWFVLIAILFTGYVILDGFDLGVGFWHLFTKRDKDKRIFMNAIGPVWDGNEVWLITGGGALFAAFPQVYATVFSGFYLPLMLVLLGLIARAISLEFRKQIESDRWKGFWDIAFSIGSIIPAILFGVALGNIMLGLPLNDDMNISRSTDTYFGEHLVLLLNPFSLIIGIFGFITIIMHGAFFLILKTEDELQDRIKKWANRSWFVFVIAYVLVSLTVIFIMPNCSDSYYILDNYYDKPFLWIFPILTICAIFLIKVFYSKERYFKAFLCSSITIALLLTTVAISMFPNLVNAVDKSKSLAINNSSSSEYTLLAMFIIALIGMPIVLGYTIWIYKKFAGKVKLDESSY